MGHTKTGAYKSLITSRPFYYVLHTLCVFSNEVEREDCDAIVQGLSPRTVPFASSERSSVPPRPVAQTSCAPASPASSDTSRTLRREPCSREGSDEPASLVHDALMQSVCTTGNECSPGGANEQGKGSCYDQLTSLTQCISLVGTVSSDDLHSRVSMELHRDLYVFESHGN